MTPIAGPAGGGDGVAEHDAAPMDTATRVTTLAIGASLVLVSAAAAADPATDRAAAAAGGVLAALILVLGYGFAPARYGVAPGRLVVRRRLFRAREFTVVGEAGRLPWAFSFGGWRLAGSGGFFGWYGRFWRRGVGGYRSYVTNRSRPVGVGTDHGLVVVSPADPEAFLRSLEAAAR